MELSIHLIYCPLARYELYDNQTLESHVRGLTTQHSQELDSAFSPELTEHLFQQQGESFGLDLVSSSYTAVIIVTSAIVLTSC